MNEVAAQKKKIYAKAIRLLRGMHYSLVLPVVVLLLFCLMHLSYFILVGHYNTYLFRAGIINNVLPLVFVVWGCYSVDSKRALLGAVGLAIFFHLFIGPMLSLITSFGLGILIFFSEVFANVVSPFHSWRMFYIFAGRTLEYVSFAMAGNLATRAVLNMILVQDKTGQLAKQIDSFVKARIH